MNCDKYTQWLSAALDGELTAEQRRELDAHLAHCPDCAALFALMGDNARAMRELDCTFPEDLHARIMKDLPAQTAPAKKGKLIHWRRWGALAACLAVVAAAALTVPRMTRAGKEAYAPTAAAPEGEAMYEPAVPGNTASSYDFEKVSDSARSEGADPAESSKQGELPQNTPNAVPTMAPESLPSPAPEAEPTDNGFGNRTPAPTRFPGIGENGLSGTLAPPTQYLRVDYGTTPPPSAVVISSASSLESYLKGFGTNRYDGEGNPVPNEALEALKETYGEDWFANRSLVAVVVESGSGSTRYEVLSVSDTTVNIRTIVPEVGTCDMAAWLLVIELDTVLDDGSVLDVNCNF